MKLQRYTFSRDFCMDLNIFSREFLKTRHFFKGVFGKNEHFFKGVSPLRGFIGILVPFRQGFRSAAPPT